MLFDEKDGALHKEALPSGSFPGTKIDLISYHHTAVSMKI